MEKKGELEKKGEMEEGWRKTRRREKAGGKERENKKKLLRHMSLKFLISVILLSVNFPQSSYVLVCVFLLGYMLLS